MNCVQTKLSRTRASQLQAITMLPQLCFITEINTLHLLLCFTLQKYSTMSGTTNPETAMAGITGPRSIVNTLSEQVKDVLARLTGIDEQLKKQEATVTQLNSEKGTLVKEKEDLQAALKKVTGKRNAHYANLVTANGRVDKLQKELDEAKADYKTVHDRMEEVTHEAVEMRSDRDRYRKNVLELEKDADESMELNEKLQDALDQAKVENATMKREVANVKRSATLSKTNNARITKAKDVMKLRVKFSEKYFKSVAAHAGTVGDDTKVMLFQAHWNATASATRLRHPDKFDDVRISCFEFMKKQMSTGRLTRAQREFILEGAREV